MVFGGRTGDLCEFLTERRRRGNGALSAGTLRLFVVRVQKGASPWVGRGQGWTCPSHLLQ